MAKKSNDSVEELKLQNETLKLRIRELEDRNRRLSKRLASAETSRKKQKLPPPQPAAESWRERVKSKTQKCRCGSRLKRRVDIIRGICAKCAVKKWNDSR